MSLVRVSRAFRNIFTPILHTRRIVNLEYFPDSEPLGERPLPPHLEHVQDFRVNVYEFNQTGTTYIPERNDEYAAWIARALESTRCLRSFRSVISCLRSKRILTSSLVGVMNHMWTTISLLSYYMILVFSVY